MVQPGRPWARSIIGKAGCRMRSRHGSGQRACCACPIASCSRWDTLNWMRSSRARPCAPSTEAPACDHNPQGPVITPSWLTWHVAARGPGVSWATCSARSRFRKRRYGWFPIALSIGWNWRGSMTASSDPRMRNGRWIGLQGCNEDRSREVRNGRAATDSHGSRIDQKGSVVICVNPWRIW